MKTGAHIPSGSGTYNHGNQWEITHRALTCEETPGKGLAAYIALWSLCDHAATDEWDVSARRSGTVHHQMCSSRTELLWLKQQKNLENDVERRRENPCHFKPQKTACNNTGSSPSYGNFCDTCLHDYCVPTRIIFFILRARTFCTFSHEPP